MKSVYRHIFLLCAVMMISVFTAVGVSAETVAGGTLSTGLEWSLDSDGVLSISGEGEMPDYSRTSAIPWYTNKAAVLKAEIGEGVERVGNRAFYGCSNMESVSLPESLTSIGNYAFNGCSALSDISLPEGVLEIGSRAFYNCKSLAEIKIPDGVSILESSTFAGCEALSVLDLGNGIFEITDSVFEGCVSLTEVILPQSIEVFGEDIFTDCSDTLILTAYYGTAGADYCAEAGYDYIIKCTVEVYSGDDVVLSLECEKDAEITFPHGPAAEEGYVFVGYDIDGTVYSEGASISVSENITANAVFAMQTFEVKLECGIATNPEPLVKKYWEDLTLDVTVTREGYDFMGWSLTENSQTVDYENGAIFTTNADTVLYAVWNEQSYIITYYMPEAENTIPEQTKLYTQKLQLSDTIPVRSGYTFMGWTAKQAALTAEYQPGDLIDINADTVLFAVWAGGIIPGDADNNGIVEMSDLMYMIMRINTFDMVLSQDNIAAMDVYCDTYFNIKDVLKMSQYLAGWTNVVLGE